MPIVKMSDRKKKKAKLLMLILTLDFYENRNLNVNATRNSNLSEKIRYTVQSLILQLRCKGDE